MGTKILLNIGAVLAESYNLQTQWNTNTSVHKPPNLLMLRATTSELGLLSLQVNDSGKERPVHSLLAFQ